MADLSRRLMDNADGNFFVDTTCIDCETHRIVTPDDFESR